jgi:hypothetical protein
MSYIDGGAITVLKEYLTLYYEKPDDEPSKDLVIGEITRILDIADQAKKAITRS